MTHELENPSTPGSENDNDGTDATRRRKPGRPKNNVWNFFIEIGQRVQGHCGARCKECGWEKKANVKTDELETHIGFRCIKTDYKIKEKYMNIIRERGNLHSNFNDNDRPLKKVKN